MYEVVQVRGLRLVFTSVGRRRSRSRKRNRKSAYDLVKIKNRSLKRSHKKLWGSEGVGKKPPRNFPQEIINKKNIPKDSGPKKYMPKEEKKNSYLKCTKKNLASLKIPTPHPPSLL